VATKRQVETKLRELIRRLADTQEGVSALSDALPEPRVIEVYVTDLDAAYWAELAGGRMGPLQRGSPDRADMRLEATSDDLVDVLDGRRSMFSSYIAGRVKVEASFADIMRLRKLA
jgi:SCP-2 sterol transfer family